MMINENDGMVDEQNSERLRGFALQTDGRMDMCNSRVAFATETK